MIVRLSPILALLFLMAFLLFGLLSAQIFEARLLPEVEAQTTTAAIGVQRRINHAVVTFGGLQTLRDVEPVLDAARASATGLTFLAIADPQGNVRHVSADDPSAVRYALTNLGEPRPETFGVRVSLIWQQITGISLIETVEQTSHRVDRVLITSLPIGSDSLKPVGVLHAGVDITLIDKLKQDILLDTATLVLAMVIVAIELLILTFAVYVLHPTWRLDFLRARLTVLDLRYTVLSGRSGIRNALIRQINEIIIRVATRAQLFPARFPELQLPNGEALPHPVRPPCARYIRLPLFLFFLSEASLRPILPQFLADFAPAESDPDFSAGLAMTGFMVTSLFAVLVGSIYAERISPRRIFVIGALFSLVGMLGHLLADNFTEILLARALTGFGYGLVYSAGQVYIAQHSKPGRRSSGFSLFLAVVVAAEITGPAVGGILADRLGTSPVLVCATLILAFSTLVCLRLVSKHPPDVTDPAREPDLCRTPSKIASSEPTFGYLHMLRDIQRNPRFLVTVFCFAIPAKALLTGGLFLLIPLTVSTMAGTVADSARVLMVYGIAVLLLLPLIAPITDRFRNYGIFMAAGSLIAGLGFVFPHAFITFEGDEAKALLAAVVLFGSGQALSIPTQVSFVMQAMKAEIAKNGSGPVLGVFRFFERLGSLAGPLIAGGLLLLLPPDLALMWMGMGTVILAACGLCWLMAIGQQNEEEAVRAMLVET